MKHLHINCDMAESFGNFIVGHDEILLPDCDACNIACGYHGGDPLVIEKTISAAISLKKEIGAHPSYPDLQGFGRRYMDLPITELKSIIRYQIAAVDGIAKSLGGNLCHIKAHGALYNMSTKSEKEAEAMVSVIKNMNPEWRIYAPFGSVLAETAMASGITVFYESFADRTYENSGVLRNRIENNAIIHDPTLVWEQVKFLLNNSVKTISGDIIPLHSNTICIHGDHPNTPNILKFIRRMYNETYQS